VVPVPGRHVTPAGLREFLAARLPEYMIPSAFVLLDRMPLTATGKLDRNAMAAARLAPITDDRTLPRTATEQGLAEIWGGILGVPALGIRSNFFALGGDSLQAVRLFAEIRRRFGRSLPLATLFQAPTIEQLATTLDEAPSDASTGDAVARRSPLVAIQPQGSRPPFFCVHPIGGEVLCYSPLALLLGPDQPFYGLQAIDEEVEATRPSLEQIAERYVAAVREFRPHGPYHLGGFSLGALVAFEMAGQLRAAGEQVELLALVDTWAATSARPTIGRVLRNAVQALPYWLLDDALRTSPAESAGRVWRKIRFLSWKVARKLGAAGDAMEDGLPDAILELRFPGYRIPLVRALHDAYARYQPRPYDGRVTLFRSRAHSVWSTEDPEAGWTRLAAGGVDVRTVPGSHTRLLKNPGLRILARQLARCLEVASPLRS
jgi:thioesterase domain-containing protein/acyl carrier protein